MKKILLMIAIIFIFGSNLLLASGDSPSPTGAPIDGGLSILLVSGVIYGGYKTWKEKKNDNKD